MTLESLAGVALWELPLLWCATAAAAVLRSFTGFGFALAAVPVYALVLPPAQAVVLCASLALVLGVQTAPQYLGHLDKRQRPVFLAAVPGTLLGAILLQRLDADQFRLLLGLVTIAASLVLSRHRPKLLQVPAGLRGLTGLASGVLNGAFAVPGPPVIVYAMATVSDPARSRAFMIGFFSFSSLLALTGFAWLGFLSWRSLWLVLLVYPAMFAGDRLGFRLFEAHGDVHYRRIAVLTCLLIGVSITLRALL
ncbi:MAG: sulfite exporter TauE/SafE family protein [Halieaceae bacterium]|nr:sulfite exporter TauE/SafE family protein [Halieaceae bacterium]